MTRYIPRKMGYGVYKGTDYLKTEGFFIIDTETKSIYVSGERYTSLVKSIDYDTTTKVLKITDTYGGVISLNFIDDTTANLPSSLLGTLRDDINSNKLAISTLNGSDEGSIDKKISDAIELLNNNISIASSNNGVVTLNTDITESNGVISNNGSSTIKLSKISTTGAADDVTITYNSATSDVLTSISDIDARLKTLSTRQIQYIEPTSEETTPNGYSHYYKDGSAYSGTLDASEETMNKIYLCKTTSYDGDYHLIMTVSSGDSYKWIDISATSIDLSGYVKSITVNGQTYTPSTSGETTLTKVVNVIDGESDIVNGNDEFISVLATSNIDSGTNTVTLLSKAKVTDIKKATSDNDGLASSYNVQEYVNSNLTTIRTWTNEDIPTE